MGLVAPTTSCNTTLLCPKRRESHEYDVTEPRLRGMRRNRRQNWTRRCCKNRTGNTHTHTRLALSGATADRVQSRPQARLQRWASQMAAIGLHAACTTRAHRAAYIMPQMRDAKRKRPHMHAPHGADRGACTMPQVRDDIRTRPPRSSSLVFGARRRMNLGIGCG